LGDLVGKYPEMAAAHAAVFMGFQDDAGRFLGIGFL
jgi:hypothetical protein